VRKKRTSFRSPLNGTTGATPNKTRSVSLDSGRISENVKSLAGAKKPAASPAPSSECNATSSSAGSRHGPREKIKSPSIKPQPSLPSAGSPEPSRSEAASATSGTTTNFCTPPALCDIPHREASPILSLTQHSQSGQSLQHQSKKVPAMADIIADELAKTQHPSTSPTSLPKSGSETTQPKPPTSYLCDSQASYLGGEGIGGSREEKDNAGRRVGLPEERNRHSRSRAPATLSKNESLLHHSWQNMVQPCDTYWERTYLPRNPYQTPRFFPEHPDPLLYEPQIFEKFDTDTLFFIFYFQQGTYQQYLAACELKKGAWRYHKKYLTWFQRHSEPEETTEEYEKGTYVYFDYDTSWCPRMKSQFVFEYSYLEDELDYVKDEFPLKK